MKFNTIEDLEQTGIKGVLELCNNTLELLEIQELHDLDHETSEYIEDCLYYSQSIQLNLKWLNLNQETQKTIKFYNEMIKELNQQIQQYL